MHRHTRGAFTRVHIGWARTADAAAAATKPVEYCFVATFAVAGCCEQTSVNGNPVCAWACNASCDASTKEEKHRTKVTISIKYRSTKKKFISISWKNKHKKNRIRFILNKI